MRLLGNRSRAMLVTMKAKPLAILPVAHHKSAGWVGYARRTRQVDRPQAGAEHTLFSSWKGDWPLNWAAGTISARSIRDNHDPKPKRRFTSLPESRKRRRADVGRRHHPARAQRT